jgi:hypothetical protein
MLAPRAGIRYCSGVRTLVLAVLFTTFAAVAHAQPAAETQLRAQIDEAGEALAKRGYELLTGVQIGQIRDDGIMGVDIHLRVGANYAIVAVCDADCADIDLVLYDPAGKEVASDVLDDDIPVLEYRPTANGTFKAHAVMADCKGDRCGYGLALFSTAVDPFDKQVRAQLAEATNVLGKQGFGAPQLIHFGALEQDQEEDATFTLEAGRDYMMVAVCDEDCSDVDLRLLTPDRKEIDRDVERDDHPVVAVSVPASGTYTVRTIMAACKQAPCRYGVGVYRK